MFDSGQERKIGLNVALARKPRRFVNQRLAGSETTLVFGLVGKKQAQPEVGDVATVTIDVRVRAYPKNRKVDYLQPRFKVALQNVLLGTSLYRH